MPLILLMIVIRATRLSMHVSHLDIRQETLVLHCGCSVDMHHHSGHGSIGLILCVHVPILQSQQQFSTKPLFS